MKFKEKESDCSKKYLNYLPFLIKLKVIIETEEQSNDFMHTKYVQKKGKVMGNEGMGNF